MSNTIRFIDLFIASLAGAAMGAVGSITYQSTINNRITEHLLQRPPVLVVDPLKLSADLPIGATEEERLQHRNNIMEVINHYKDDGYLILRRDSLIHAPNKNTLTQ
ncbi:MAG: hypothetical protein N0E42_12040 [Candidatus Thiodiazotropha endolucinida]|nr:hypothetical protein [Candidatus Thiodiazotropha taylori]MCW4225202.1 hypothetical protein [Candidatus Thiodiazotropha endolucinida]MCG7880754.1 hypothetical protein [Candidatus Thiodiazotropha taylori]MCG7886773.1 hypothetical protein [Candidatus Thiodiazotropha taylori]MCG8028161.1 hypothetical protein [Candidatus Thiodiazotropha taylori]